MYRKDSSVMKKDDRRLRIGLLGCGPISQAAHLDAIRKARNADLCALCDVAEGLTGRVAAICQPEAVYNDFTAMLDDPQVEAVVIAVADQFHVPLCRQALAAGKPVLKSLRGQFTNERAVAAVARLERLPADRPLADLRSAAAMRVPALVLAHQQDPVHRFAFGEALAGAIPGARLVELIPKSIARERHAAEVQNCLEAFLNRLQAEGARGENKLCLEEPS
jgi:hypothetical protein